MLSTPQRLIFISCITLLCVNAGYLKPANQNRKGRNLFADDDNFSNMMDDDLYSNLDDDFYAKLGNIDDMDWGTELGLIGDQELFDDVIAQSITEDIVAHGGH